MKKILLFLILLFSNKIFANAAAPGFYNNGGSSDFIPFFASDRAYLDEIQMQSELITILLYPNFAVVRGEYNMLNSSDKEIVFNTGYPINASFDDSIVSRVGFEDIYGLKIFVDGTEVPNEKLKATDSTFALNEKTGNSFSNWYVWKSNFKPGAITKIKVYFIVNTSGSILRRGYSKDTNNGFVYILESGRAWGKNIERGRINIQLMDGLKAGDIMGISPQKFVINDEGNSLIYDFRDLEPKSNDNILLRYKKIKTQFDFQPVISEADKYYNEIDRIQPGNIFAGSYKNFTAADFEVHDTSGTNVFGYLMIFLVFGVPLIIILLITGLVIFIILRRKKRKKQELNP